MVYHVFICYSNKDREFAERLHEHLAPLAQQGEPDQLIEVFRDDLSIREGDHIDDVITQAIGRTNLTIFLVSIDFLNSNYIKRVELRSLLQHTVTAAARTSSPGRALPELAESWSATSRAMFATIPRLCATDR